MLELKKCLSSKRVKSDKNNFRILKKPHAFLQTIVKAPVKFQKDQPKTVGGVKGTRYLLPIYFCSIRTLKTSVVLELKKCLSKKCGKSDKKLFQDSEKTTCTSSGHPESPCKVSKGSAKNCGRSKGDKVPTPYTLL